jgi:hypothetical protein
MAAAEQGLLQAAVVVALGAWVKMPALPHKINRAVSESVHL